MILEEPLERLKFPVKIRWRVDSSLRVDVIWTEVRLGEVKLFRKKVTLYKTWK